MYVYHYFCVVFHSPSTQTDDDDDGDDVELYPWAARQRHSCFQIVATKSRKYLTVRSKLFNKEKKKNLVSSELNWLMKSILSEKIEVIINSVNHCVIFAKRKKTWLWEGCCNSADLSCEQISREFDIELTAERDQRSGSMSEGVCWKNWKKFHQTEPRVANEQLFEKVDCCKLVLYKIVKMLSTLIRAGSLQTMGRQFARSVETPVQMQHVRFISKSSEVNSDYMTMRENQTQKVSRDYNSKLQVRLKKVSR